MPQSLEPSSGTLGGNVLLRAMAIAAALGLAVGLYAGINFLL